VGIKTTTPMEGGASMMMHNGQSMVWADADASPSPNTTNLIAPALEHTNSMSLGFTTGDATATPNDKANHTSTRRARCIGRRNDDMRQILDITKEQTLIPVNRHHPTQRSNACPHRHTPRKITNSTLVVFAFSTPTSIDKLNSGNACHAAMAVWR